MTGASGPPHAEALQTFAPTPASPGEARRWVGVCLREWAVTAVGADLSLVVSELVTNAVVHGSGPVRLRLEQRDGCVRLEVTDDGAGRVEPRSPDPDAPGGRGLLVVAHLAAAWGVARLAPVGKTVWVELAVPAAAVNGAVSGGRRGASGGT